MVLLQQQIEGATPLGPDEMAGLKPLAIFTQADLNIAEEANILAGMQWARRTRRTDILNRDFIATLHARMFGEVWTWAGTWRRRQTNIGVAPNAIVVEVEALLRDVAYWAERHTFADDEIAVRLHHRLVWVHPFPNGNGRHTRLLADLWLQSRGAAPFSWGRTNLGAAGEARQTYIAALRDADRGSIDGLVAFARS